MALELPHDKTKKSLVDPSLHVQMFDMAKNLTSNKMQGFLGFIRMVEYDIAGEADSSVLLKSKFKAEKDYAQKIKDGAQDKVNGL